MAKTFWMTCIAAYSAMVWCAAADRTEATAYRDPFWPVGYEQKAVAKKTSGEEPKQALFDLSRLSPEEQAIIKSHTRVGGILEQGGRRVAIINSDVVREGETLSIRVQGQTYRFLIQSLQPRNIVLEPLELEEQGQAQSEEEKETS